MLDRLPSDLLIYTSQFADAKSYVPLVGTNRSIRHTLKSAPYVKWNAYLNTLETLERVFTKRENVLMHGPGGTGKSFTINAIHKVAKQRGIQCAVTSTTGISALGLPEGRTIHSFSGLKKASMTLDKLRANLQRGRGVSIGVMQDWRRTELLIVDEISMLGASFLEKLHLVASVLRGNAAFMGGLQVVFSGDFLQLPPVLDQYVFTSPVFARARFHRVNFEVSFRHGNDKQYSGLLKRVRTGRHSEDDVRALENKVRPDVPMVVEPFQWTPPRLFPLNKQVKVLNDVSMDSLATTQAVQFAHALDVFKRYDGRNWVTVAPRAIDKRRKAQMDHASPPVLRLVTGGQYFITYNFGFRQGFVNGARALFDGTYLVLKNGVTCPFRKANVLRTFPLGNGLFLQREQLALRPGYASSIHASQGTTLDEAIVDLGASVRGYQAYVALSRVRTLNGLTLVNFDRSSLRCHQGALQYLGLAPPPKPKKSKQEKRRERLKEWFQDFNRNKRRKRS